MPLVVKDGNGATQNLSVVTNGDGSFTGLSCIQDPVTPANKLSITQLHNADKQSLAGAALFGIMESGPVLLADSNGLADRLREVGYDGVPAVGILSGVENVLRQISQNSGTGAVGAPGAATITPTNMSGTVDGIGWAIGIGTTILYDVGGANQEAITVTGVTATTYTATFAKTHSAGVTTLVDVYNRMKQAPGAPGVVAVSSDGSKATFRYAVAGFTPVATPTAFLVIAGSATKTVRIKSIKIGGVATANGNMQVQAQRWSTAGTLGSAVLTALTAVKHDTNDAAATATVSTVGTANYTTPGTGSTVPAIVDRIGLCTTATGVPTPLKFDFSTRQDKAFILRGTTDILVLSGNSSAVPAGGVLDIEVETEEDNS
jgi:hypothetical protein